MNKSDIESRLAFRKSALSELYDAYLALISGRVASYTIGSRNLTRFDVTKLKDEIDALEKEIDGLQSLLNGGGRRKAVGVIPRDC